jgi:competence ComEA-like helix-hairpin-helix protein
VRRRLIALAATTWAMAAAAGMSVSVPPLSAAQFGLPAGEGLDTVEATCGECHGAELLGSQRRSRVEFEALIEDMTGRAGGADDEIKQVILAYALRHFGRVNINTASDQELVQIVDLTAAEATAIVDHRKQSGEFKSLEDLRKVAALDFTRIQERKERIGFTGP